MQRIEPPKNRIMRLAVSLVVAIAVMVSFPIVGAILKTLTLLAYVMTFVALHSFLSDISWLRGMFMVAVWLAALGLATLADASDAPSTCRCSMPPRLWYASMVWRSRHSQPEP